MSALTAVHLARCAGVPTTWLLNLATGVGNLQTLCCTLPSFVCPLVSVAQKHVDQSHPAAEIATTCSVEAAKQILVLHSSTNRVCQIANALGGSMGRWL